MSVTERFPVMPTLEDGGKRFHNYAEAAGQTPPSESTRFF